MTTARRKYRFKDRAEAEEAEKAREREAWMARYCFAAHLAGQVEWFRGRWYDVGRVGRDRMDEGYVVEVFHNRGDPSSRTVPGVAVYSLAESREHYRKMCRVPPSSGDGMELRELLGRALAGRSGVAAPPVPGRVT